MMCMNFVFLISSVRYILEGKKYQLKKLIEGEQNKYEPVNRVFFFFVTFSLSYIKVGVCYVFFSFCSFFSIKLYISHYKSMDLQRKNLGTSYIY